jgi:hypothetical protein
MRAFTRALCFLFLAPCCACGCVQPGEQTQDNQDPHQPGEIIGFFSVTGKLSNDSCGAASLSAPDKWSFQVKLSREGNTLYWLNGREAIVGDIDKSGSFAFETHIDVPLAPKHGAAKGCTMVRRDSASGTLESSASSLNGKLSYGYEATTDSDCSEFTTGTAGQPIALPCSLTYTLNGARVPE